ncbi:MAG: nuclear transport factor 2 family protein [Candidatus Eremiobacteraeota bacterium]|nr:nuclear transport factor 2 family protein [Candidatus Eremiobacteraeota bacterium]MBV8498584.1 nuclear transport factor 2 family protein [Candidatus Eremiobacteraeota bacterium]
MKLRAIAAGMALALAPGFAAATSNAPPAPVLKLANAAMHAANTNDASAFAGLYTEDAVVVDEVPPFIWRGAGAGTAWWHAVASFAQKMKMTHLRATDIRVGEFKESVTDAYLVEPMTVTGIANGKPFAEAGTTTYTFHNSGGTWLISSQVWTTKP